MADGDMALRSFCTRLAHDWRCAGLAVALVTAAFAPVSPARADDGPGTDISTSRRAPQEARAGYLEFMKTQRPATTETFLNQRFDWGLTFLNRTSMNEEREFRAFLMTPREEFAISVTRQHAYDDAFLDIGFGVTISGPFMVARMTQVIEIKPTDKVLEIGTGSGYQSAVISQLTSKSYSIEIIAPLAERTHKNYERLIAAGYKEFANIHQKQADGYWGWDQEAPFDKIIVTCAIDHVPPSLLQQLAVGGIMVIPVGPPGKQTLLKITKVQQPDGTITIKREDVYKGARKVSFVPFTRAEGGTWSGRGLADK
jgi:protein-L-isoaspartate(D-aspartate) O-methyltransferase